MKKQLNQFEIAQIVQFLKENGVKHYDIQLEMVDHFATTIEEKWDDYPSGWNFKLKILDTFNPIGQKGFEKMVAEKMSAANQKAYQYAFFLVKQFFKLPQIILSLGIVVYLFELLQNPTTQRGVFNLGIIIPPIIVFLVTATTIFINWRKNKKRMIGLESNIHLFMIPNGLTVFAQIYNDADQAFPQGDWTHFGMAVLVFLQVLFCIGLCVFVINSLKAVKQYFPKYT